MIKFDEVSPFILPIWQRRRQLVIVVIFSAMIGGVVGFLSEKEYTSTTAFIPQSSTSKGPGLANRLGGLATLAGIDVAQNQDYLDLSPALYSDLLNDPTFQLSLLSSKLLVPEVEDSITYRDYYNEYYRASTISIIKKYTLGIPRLLLSKFRSKPSNVGGVSDAVDNDAYIRISIEDQVLIKRLLGQLTLDFQNDKGVASLSFTMPTPSLSAQMLAHFRDLVHQRLFDFKTKKIRNELEFLRKQYESKKEDFNSAQVDLSSFQDQNLSLTSYMSKNKLRILESNYDIAFELYKNVAVQIEEAKINLEKDTPLFTVIKPIVFPIIPSSLSIKWFVIITTFLGFTFFIVFIYLSQPLFKFIKNLKALNRTQL